MVFEMPKEPPGTLAATIKEQAEVSEAMELKGDDKFLANYTVNLFEGTTDFKVETEWKTFMGYFKHAKPHYEGVLANIRKETGKGK